MSDQYYRHFPGDYLRDTGDLTLIEHGAYRILLDHYYTQESLPADRDRLYRMCRAFTQEEKDAINAVVDRFFSDNGHGRIVNKRAEKEIQGRKIYNENLRVRGNAGAAARWGKVTMPKAMPVALPNAMLGKCHPSPSPKKRKKEKTGSVFFLPEWFPKEVWSEFLSHRKAIKAPVSETSFPGFLVRFCKLRDQGWEPRRVVDVMVERGWKWFKVEWMKDKDKGKPSGNMTIDEELTRLHREPV